MYRHTICCNNNYPVNNDGGDCRDFIKYMDQLTTFIFHSVTQMTLPHFLPPSPFSSFYPLLPSWQPPIPPGLWVTSPCLQPEHLTLLPHLWRRGPLQSTMQWLSADCCGPLDSFHLISRTKLLGNEVGGSWNFQKKRGDSFSLWWLEPFRHCSFQAHLIVTVIDLAYYYATTEIEYFLYTYIYSWTLPSAICEDPWYDNT